MSRWDVIIPLVVAIIAATGGIIPILINNQNTRLQPEVIAHIVPHHQDPSDPAAPMVYLSIDNRGSAPATNVSLMFQSAAGIMNVTNYFSSSEIFSKIDGKQLKIGESREINSTFLELYIPRLVQGTGSSVQLTAFLQNFVTDPDQFRLSLIYDQGSVGLSQGRLTISESFSEFWSAYGVYYLTLYVIILATLILVIIYYKRKRRRRRFIRQLLDDLVELRRKLSLNIMTKELFEFNWFNTKNPLKPITTVREYILIDDLYRKVKQRNDSITTDKVEELNRECLDLVNKTLDIEWEKYR